MRLLDRIFGRKPEPAPVIPTDPMADALAAAKAGDYATALSTWERLAQDGVARAQNNLGACYAEGLGVPKDRQHAGELLRQSAEAGEIEQRAQVGAVAIGETAEQRCDDAVCVRQSPAFANSRADFAEHRAQLSRDDRAAMLFNERQSGFRSQQLIDGRQRAQIGRAGHGSVTHQEGIEARSLVFRVLHQEVQPEARDIVGNDLERRVLVLIKDLHPAMAGVADFGLDGGVLVAAFHVYAAIWTRGTLRAMTRGTVTGGWAFRHHRKWFKELAQRRRVDPAE